MALINTPSAQDWPGITNGAINWLNQVFRACRSVYDSGTTAQRPTSGLWAGRGYFDTTLGKPIWYSGSGWVDATGASA